MTHQLSASQINTYRDCPRKWAFQYIEKIKPPPHPSAEIGIEAHKHLEDYETQGIYPEGLTPAVKMAQAAIEYREQNPFTSGPTIAEAKFAFETDAGVFRGLMDLQYRDSHTGLHTIHDYKTTGNLKYAQTPESLTTDIQATIYAKAACTTHQTDEVLCRWMYITRTKNPQIHIVTRKRLLPDIDKTLVPIVKTGRKMQALMVERPRALDVAGDPDACGKYGGCPFLATCYPPTERTERKEREMSDAASRILELAKQKSRAAKARAAAEAEEAAAAAQIAEAEAEAEAEAKAKAEAEAAAKAAAEAVPAINPPEGSKRKRGRPRKTPEAPPTPEPPPAHPPSSASGWILAIHTGVLKWSAKSRVVALEEILFPAERELCESRGVSYFRELGSYGEGDGKLKLALEAYLDKHPIAPGAIVIATPAMYGYANPTVMEVLRSRASIVLHGLK